MTTRWSPPSEWGERVLLDELVAGEYKPAELASAVAAGVRAALACLHSVGLVHSDVAPNNIYRVAGVWKLGDLDNVVHTNELVTGVPAPLYRLEGVNVGDRARPAQDEHGLRQVIDKITSNLIR